MREHRNNIGLLRLILASAVIIGHAPEIVDGNPSREPLTQIFHTITLGGLAVDGFFLISGFLITQSMQRSSSVWDYLIRRVLRIVPAFVVAYLISVFVVGSLIGAPVMRNLGAAFIRLAMLKDPMAYPGASHGLNGSMWSIIYEFRCYLLVALLGVSGLLRRRSLVLAATIVMMALSVVLGTPRLAGWVNAVGQPLDGLIGVPLVSLRLTTVFLVGASVFLYREWLDRLGGVGAAIAALACVALLFVPAVAGVADMTLGAVALFWLGFKARLGPLQPINDRWDISYGVYLYGWPIAILLLDLGGIRNPFLLGVATLPLSLVAGAASWWGVEVWTKDLWKNRRRKLLTATNPPTIPESTVTELEDQLV